MHIYTLTHDIPSYTRSKVSRQSPLAPSVSCGEMTAYLLLPWPLLVAVLVLLDWMGRSILYLVVGAFAIEIAGMMCMLQVARRLYARMRIE